jgi:hypothetical protein
LQGSKAAALRGLGPSMLNLDLIQWPAMVVTVAAAWYVASTRKRRRHGEK